VVCLCCLIVLWLQVCLDRVFDGSVDGGGVGGQQERNRSDFVVKLRRAALRSAQKLHEQQQQQQQQQEGNGVHGAVPRMCGVMDWLVRLLHLGSLEV
jgi:hypothetical protein